MRYGVWRGRARGIPFSSFPPSAGVVVTPKDAVTLPSRSGFFPCHPTFALRTLCLNFSQEDFLDAAHLILFFFIFQETEFYFIMIDSNQGYKAKG